ncbi:FkbM family methyltransferase [Nostoc sp. UHCC 0702]|nr:FkbM family methyltransferase [Nostoc sp. UHCC 0702]
MKIIDLTYTKVINLIKESIPKSLLLPLRYKYRRMIGTLEREMMIINKLVPRKGCAIDVGANQGIYTYVLAEICSVVEAFEPQPDCAELIVKYGKKFSKNINVHNCGLSNVNGTLSLKIPVVKGKVITGLASFVETNYEYNSLDVPVRRLDDYNFKNVVFIKIDVEGYERQVIEGARETILREKPILLVEIEQRHLNNISIKTVFDEILQLQYKGFFLYQDKLVNIEEFSLEKYQNLSRDTGINNLRNKNYINNFIFKPAVSNS